MFKSIKELKKEIDSEYRKYLMRGLFCDLDEIIDSDYVPKHAFAYGYIKNKLRYKKLLRKRTCPYCKRVYDTEKQAATCAENCKRQGRVYF